MALSLGIRVALLPLTIRLARRMQRNQEVARTLQPEIDALKRRFEKHPELLFGETQKIYQKYGYSPFDIPAMVGSFLQLPIFGVLYRAIRQSMVSAGPFLWIRSLASPDLLLTLVVLSLTGISAYFVPSTASNAKVWIISIQILITGFIIWKLAAALSLYWFSSSAVALVQSYWLRRDFRQNAGRT